MIFKWINNTLECEQFNVNKREKTPVCDVKHHIDIAIRCITMQ